jgi:hypothetical protein
VGRGREDDFEEFDGLASQIMRLKDRKRKRWGGNESKYITACDDEGR